MGKLRDFYSQKPNCVRWIIVTVTPLAATSAVIALLFVWGVTYEMSPRRMCGSHGSYTHNSPDGKYRAVLYEYDCGATTDFGTNVAILPASKKFDPFDVDEDEHVFGADSNHQAVLTDINGILSVAVVWKDAHNLQIAVPRNARTFTRKGRSGPVSIEYLPVD